VRQTTLILAALVLFGVSVLAQDNIPEPTQRTDVPYRLFRSENIHTLLKLDTRAGLIWQVQWGDSGYRLNYLTTTNRKWYSESSPIVVPKNHSIS
jgi:hypothetical protein